MVIRFGEGIILIVLVLLGIGQSAVFRLEFLARFFCSVGAGSFSFIMTGAGKDAIGEP